MGGWEEITVVSRDCGAALFSVQCTIDLAVLYFISKSFVLFTPTSIISSTTWYCLRLLYSASRTYHSLISIANSPILPYFSTRNRPPYYVPLREPQTSRRSDLGLFFGNIHYQSVDKDCTGPTAKSFAELADGGGYTNPYGKRTECRIGFE